MRALLCLLLCTTGFAATLDTAYYAPDRGTPYKWFEGAPEVKTYFEIHTRNANAALFVNGKRVLLSGKTWLTSYSGRKERTLRAVMDINEGENTVGIIAKADGSGPGIRMQAGRATTDSLWRWTRKSSCHARRTSSSPRSSATSWSSLMSWLT